VSIAYLASWFAYSSHLLNHNTTQRVRHEYDRPLFLLWLTSARLLRLYRCAPTHIFLISLVNQTAQQTLCVVDDIGGGLAEGSRGIVAEGKDAGILDLVRQEVFEPECIRLRVCPGVDGIAAQAVHGDYADGVSATLAPKLTITTLY
jgi:hypothetical protein